MLPFRTIVETPKADFTINHQSKIMMLGSCFAENIGARLKELKFNIDLNPFGVIFNPLSVAESIERLLNQQAMDEKELFYHNECWNSFMHHSRFSNPEKQECLSLMNQRIQDSSGFLKTADYLYITFGTAWAYYQAENGQPVSNCHKLPAQFFNRKLLEVTEIVNIYKAVFEKLLNINPKLKIILTVSPVRHIKDGASGNQLSKAVLVIAVHELCKTGLSEYFPAYEMMLDDLRDYRFYASDMLHPNELAIDYIFEKFAYTFFEDSTKHLNNELKKITTSLNHRPVNSKSEGFKSFRDSISSKIDILAKEFPYLDFSSEKEYFENKKI